MKGKNSKRSRAKYPALLPEYNLKTRFDEIDYDYIHKLSNEEKEWLNRFTEEYINAEFRHSGEKLHNTAELKKSCYDKNNARNRCIYTKAKASNQLIFSGLIKK